MCALTVHLGFAPRNSLFRFPHFYRMSSSDVFPNVRQLNHKGTGCDDCCSIISTSQTVVRQNFLPDILSDSERIPACSSVHAIELWRMGMILSVHRERLEPLPASRTMDPRNLWQGTTRLVIVSNLSPQQSRAYSIREGTFAVLVRYNAIDTSSNALHPEAEHTKNVLELRQAVDCERTLVLTCRLLACPPPSWLSCAFASPPKSTSSFAQPIPTTMRGATRQP